MNINAKFARDLFLLIFLAILGVALLYILQPFLALITIALILVQFFLPVYKFLFRYFKSKFFSSLISTMIVVCTILIPTLILFIIATQDILNLINQLTQTLTDSGLLTTEKIQEIKADMLGQLNSYGVIEELKNINITSMITSPSIIGTIADAIASIFGTITNIVIFLIILIITIIFLFMEYDRIPEVLTKYSPLDNSIDRLFFKKFEQTTVAVIRGSFLVAAAQATIMILPMAAFNIPALALWWIIMFVLSVLPLGSGFVWLPLGIFMIISPNFNSLSGIFLIIYGTIGINLVDSILRPLVTKGGTGLHPLMALLSALGGLLIFKNPLGLLYGPLIAVFYKTLAEIYQEKFSHDVELPTKK